MQKQFDGYSFSPHGIIVSCPIERSGKIITANVEVVDAPIDYKFMLGHIWIHVMISIVSSESQVIRFPHWGNIAMIEQLD